MFIKAIKFSNIKSVKGVSMFSGRTLFMVFAFFLFSAFADETFDKLVEKGKWEEALKYADSNIPPASRNADIWVKIACANEKLNLNEKALACYTISWRNTPNHYPSILGAARIYNKLNQPENALNMAEKALELNFTVGAGWEYAQACLLMKKQNEARGMLEKVLEIDPSNVSINCELGKIYYSERSYDKAINLLQTAYKEQGEADIAFKIGKCYAEKGGLKDAISFFKKALKKKDSFYEANLELAGIYYKAREYKDAAAEFDRVFSKINFTAENYYMQAVSKEQIGNAGEAIKAYENAVASFGTAASGDALVARLKVGLANMAAKNYPAALSHFQFIYNIDNTGRIIPDIHFLLADGFEAVKMPSKAISVLEQAITVDKKNVKAYSRLAGLYEQNKMPEKAKEAYETIISLDSEDPHAYLSLGKYHLYAKNYDVAFDLFLKSNNRKQSADATEGIAMAAFELGKWDIAKRAAEAAITMNPEAWNTHVILSAVYLKEKLYPNAAAHLVFMVKKQPANSSYWKQVAVCYKEMGEVEKLAEADKKIIGLDKQDVDSRHRLAKYSLLKKDAIAALSIYQELATLTPGDAGVFKNLFEICRNIGKKNDAITNLKTYLSLNPKDALAYRDLGNLLYDNKEYEASLNAYQQAIKLDPEVKGFYKQYTELVAKKGNQAVLVTVLTNAIRLGDADVAMYCALARIYQGKRDYENALALYKKAIQLDPQNTAVLSVLAECQAGTGNENDAIISYEQVIMMNPKAIEEYKALGDLYRKQNKADLAIEKYKKYLEKIPNGEIAEHVGMYLFEQKQYKEAAKYLGMAGDQTGKTFAYALTYGEACYYSGDFKKAIDLFEGLFKREPKAGTIEKILRLLAESYEKTGENIKAAGTYGTYIKMGGVRDAEASYKVAFLQEKENPQTAIKVYETNIKLFPQDARNYYQLGLLYTKTEGMISKAIPLLQKTIELTNNTVPEAWAEMARAYGRIGNEENELRAYKKYAEMNPSSLEANQRIGTILLNKGEISEGIIYLEMTDNLSPNNPDILCLLAKGYKKTNRGNKALELLEKAKALKRDDPEIIIQLAKLYNEKGENKKAIREIQGLVEAKRDNKYMLIYAEILFDGGNYKDVANAIADIRTSDPENIDVLMLLAKAQKAQKRYEDAIVTYKEICDINRDYAPALYEMAEAYMVTSNFLRADLFYNRALQRDPNFALAELGLAKLAKIHKNGAQYAEHMKRASKLEPNNELIVAELKKASNNQ